MYRLNSTMKAVRPKTASANFILKYVSVPFNRSGSVIEIMPRVSSRITKIVYAQIHQSRLSMRRSSVASSWSLFSKEGATFCISAALINADPPDSFLSGEGVMFVFFRRPGSNRKAVLQNNDLITAELSESNAHTPMLLRHWFGLSSCANNFRLVVFPMFRSRGALQTVID